MPNPIINPLSSIQTDPIRNFRFLVEILPLSANNKSLTFNSYRIGFTNVSGFGVTIDPIAYREGGYNTNMHYMPGQASFQPISFTRGQTLGGKQHRDWMYNLFQVIQGQGTSGLGQEFRCNINVHVLSHPNPNAKTMAGENNVATDALSLHKSMSFKIYNAWINSLVYGDLAAGGNGLMVEGMTVVHEGFEVHYADNFTTSAITTGFGAGSTISAAS